jgi:hypothetical protein
MFYYLIMSYIPSRISVKDSKSKPRIDLSRYEKVLYDLKEEYVSLVSARSDSSREAVWEKIADTASIIEGETKRLELIYGLRYDINFLNFQRNIDNLPLK